MALSRIVYEGDGSTNQYAITFDLGYIKEEDVTCRVGDEVDGLGDPLYRALTFITPTLVEIEGTVPADGERIVFDRTVDRSQLIVDYEDGAVMNEVNLNTSQKQAIMLVQEVLDGRFETFQADLSMGGFKLLDVGTPTDPTDGATKGYVDGQISTGAANAAAAAASAAAALASQNAASSSQAAAASAADLAQRWAEEDEDVEVVTDKYSALHWAAKAAETSVGYTITAAEVATTTIPAARTTIVTSGYTAPGDGGHGVYTRVGSEPTHPGKLQSDDGAWWELGEQTLTPQQFGATGDGTADDLPELLNLFAVAAHFSSTYGACHVLIPGYDYYLDKTGTSDTILIPSNTTVDCLAGANFIYDWFGKAPVFAMIETENSKFTGYIFTFTGTWVTATLTGAGGGFGAWTGNIPGHRYACDLAILGSNYCTAHGRHTVGSTANVQNIGLLIEGPDDGTSFSYGHDIDVFTDGHCQGVMTSGIAKFRIKVHQSNLPQDSEALYGAGHAVYDVIERNSFDGEYDIFDSGEYQDTYQLTASHTLSLKWAEDVRVKVNSHRAAGPLNFAQTQRCVFDINYEYDGTVVNASVGSIYYTGQGGTANDNRIVADIHLTGAARDTTIYSSTSGALTNAINNTIADINFSRNVVGTEGAAIKIGETGGILNITSKQVGVDGRCIAEFATGSSNVELNVHVRAGSGRVILNGSATNHRITKTGVVITEENETTIAAATLGNTVTQTLARYKNRVANGSSSTTPSKTFQLPTGGGAFLVFAHLADAGFNHGIYGLYMVMYDNFTNDWTNCTLIGSQQTKGTVITGLIVTVSETGLVTMSGTATLSQNHRFEYGYLELHRR